MTSSGNDITREREPAEGMRVGPAEDGATNKSERAPRRASLVERMKADIVSGTYHRGEWLRLADLEKRYGASRTEVRKALVALATMKALEHVENYGYRIVVVDAERNQQYREIRYVLEFGGRGKDDRARDPR